MSDRKRTDEVVKIFEEFNDDEWQLKEDEEWEPDYLEQEE
jgi:hypothetical protein